MQTYVENTKPSKKTKAAEPQKAASSSTTSESEKGLLLEYEHMFFAMDTDGDGLVACEDLLSKIDEVGISKTDSRIVKAVGTLRQMPSKIDLTQFKALIDGGGSLLKNILQNRMIIPDFPLLCRDIEEIFNQVKTNRAGEVANYIPQLGRVDPEQFAVSVTTVSGQRFSLGDATTDFCLQSVSKPINYCLALEEHGSDVVHKHIGREPSGRGFNELSLNNNGLPHNPMINSGAIMSCSLIRPQLNLADRFDYILKQWSRLSGNARIGFNNPVYLSERETADRNFALGYFMREKGAFPENTNLVQTLEFYFQCCSIDVNSEFLSVAAASLANGGVCPTTGEKIFSSMTVQHCLSLMGSCGMYDFSGEFAFSIGLPSKSGVSGAVLVVIPNVMGIAIWSPRLDSHGNSVRGIEFCQKLVERFNFHVYDNILVGSSNKKDPRLKKNSSQIEGIVQLCWACSQGDLSEVQRLVASGINPDWADYDGRTPLHLAASDGQAHVVKYLISKSVNIAPTDRWGGTPYSDAKRGSKKEVIEVFENLAAA